MSEHELSLETLHVQCEDEIVRFYQQGDKNTSACYELFRRALYQNNSLAFASIFKIYEFLVRKWVARHDCYPLTGASVEHFVSAAFSSFYFSLRGNSLEKFPTVSQLLGYLKTCVHTSILQHLRSEKKHYLETEISEEIHANPVETTVEAGDLWRHLCTLVTGEADQVLMRCAFVEDWKPGEIAELYPIYWDSPRSVTIALHRIRKLLRRDPLVKQLAGIKEIP